MNPAWEIQTGRLRLIPVNWQDLPDLVSLKGDPGVYAQMLGGVAGPQRVAEELARDTSFWAARGVGMWMVREGGAAVGLTGIHDRPDGRGLALRFAFRPEARGKGLGREAAGAGLRFAHDRAGLARVIAVARQGNIASRTLLGSIGMRSFETFLRDGEQVHVYESCAPTISSPIDASWR